MATLHPAKDPGNSAQIPEASRLASPRRTRTNPRVFQFMHRSCFLKVRQNVWVFDDALAIESKSSLRHFFHGCFSLPFFACFPFFIAVRTAWSCQCLQRGRNHKL